jgi:hypothetical protein
MTKLERNVYVTCEACPNQAEGTIGGNPFYYRGRWGGWRMTIVKPGCDPVWPKDPTTVLFERDGEDGEAGFTSNFLWRVYELLDSFEAGLTDAKA